jgi:CHAD domain-containing protein
MNTSTFCDRLWRKRLNALSAVWPDFVGGRIDGLHKTRVASRRIREALPVVGATASPAKVKKLNRKMRELTRYLGPIRELDVELGLLEDESKTEAVVSDRALELVRREVAARRQMLRHELAENAPVADLKKLLKKLERIGNANGTEAKNERHGKKAARSEEAWRGVLAARLLRRAKTLGASLDQAGPLYVPERIHGVRISTKKLRYALEIAHEAGEARAGALVKVLKKRQARLGRLHDLQALLKHVREAEASPVVGSRVNDLTAYADSLERECRQLHAEFVEHRADLIECVKEVRHQLVPALTTAPRRQARVAATRRTAPRPRARVR